MIGVHKNDLGIFTACQNQIGHGEGLIGGLRKIRRKEKFANRFELSILASPRVRRARQAG